MAGMPQYGNLDSAFVRQDSYGNLWLGTMRDGLYFMDMKKLYMCRVNVLGDAHIEAMVEDANRQVWVTTMRNAFFLSYANRAFLMSSLLKY